MFRSIIPFVLSFSSMMRPAVGILFSFKPSLVIEVDNESVKVDADWGVLKTLRGVNVPRVCERHPLFDATLKSVLVANLFASFEVDGFHLGLLSMLLLEWLGHDMLDCHISKLILLELPFLAAMPGAYFAQK